MTNREQLIKALRAFENDLRLGRQVWIPASTMQAAADMLEADGVPAVLAFKHSDGTWHDPSTTEHSAGMQPLYPAPQPTKPVQRAPLTDEQIDAIGLRDSDYDDVHQFRRMARAIESAHGIGAKP